MLKGDGAPLPLQSAPLLSAVFISSDVYTWWSSKPKSWWRVGSLDLQLLLLLLFLFSKYNGSIWCSQCSREFLIEWLLLGVTDVFDLFGLTTQDAAVLLKCKTPTDLLQIWTPLIPQQKYLQLGVCRGARAAFVKIKHVDKLHVITVTVWLLCRWIPFLPVCQLFSFFPCLFQVELDQEKGLEMRKWVLSGILASEETYLSHLEALLIVCVIWKQAFKRHS